MRHRTRPAEYDDVVDGMEEVYPSRMKGEVLIDRDVRYRHDHGHRMPRATGPPVAPVAEILPDRRHRRGRSKPEHSHEELEYLRDDVLAAERRARLDLDAYRTEEARKYREERYSVHQSLPRPQPRISRRRHSKISDVEEVYFSHDDSDNSTTESEADEMDDFIERKRLISRHDFVPHKEALPRSKSLKEKNRVRQSVYDKDVYPKGSHSLEECGRGRKGSHHDTIPRPRHRSHYHIDLAEDETTESDESVDVVPTRGRQEMVRRNHPEPKYSTRRRATSSSSSSPESAGSSEEELPKVPLPIPVPPLYKESSGRRKALGHVPVHQIPRPPSPPSPPRVPSLKTVLNEREVRHRKKLERAGKKEIENGRRSRESLQLSSEPPARQKKGKPTAIVEEPEATGHRDILLEDERGDRRVTYREREFIEERYRQEPQPMRSSPHSDSMDDWAIVQAPSSKSKYSPERESPAVDVREESRHTRQRDGPVINLAVDGNMESKHKGDTLRGKVGPRYIGVRDRRDRLWTEITKDLVVREAIERAGYEYEEFDSFYYIFSYLRPDDVSALAEDSDNIRRARRRRIKEIQRERASLPPSSRRSPNKSAHSLAERPPSPPVPPSPPRQHREDRREERRRIVRERERERERVPVGEDIAIEESDHWRARPGLW
ncbi:hypothetical protein BDW66DRAFT_55850 [Aspergillus desertorum]